MRGTRPARIARSADAAAAVKPPAFGGLDRPRTEASAGRAVPRLSRRLSPAATCGARGSPSVPLSRPVPTRDVSRVGLLDLLLQEAALDAHHLRPPPDVTVLAAEARVGKGAHQLARERLADHACADAENVQIVVLHRLVRRVMIVTNAGPDAGELVGGDTDADTAAAHRDPTLRPPRTHRLVHALGHLRVVRRLARVVGPEVGDLVPARAQLGHDGRLQRVPGVIRGDDDPHGELERSRTRPGQGQAADPNLRLGSGPDARVERSVTRARRMSRPAKAGATDEVRPAPPTPLWRCLSSPPKAGSFTAAAASADRAMRAGRVPRMPRWLRQPRHGSRAWYCPFTLASGSDPRHESRVALLGLGREHLLDDPRLRNVRHVIA